MTRRPVAALALFAVCVCATPVVAQETAEPTDAQVQLYAKATEAYQQEEFGAAIDLLTSALALGELNALYLNLGRAYFRNGQCAKAEEAYAKALKAPAMSEPSPSAVRAKVDEYRVDMKQGCPGTLVLTCTPAEMRVSVDGGEEQECGELVLPVGKHVVRGTLMDKSAETTVEITSLGRTEAALSVEMTVARPEPDPVPQESGGVGIATWTTLGLGALTVGTAFVLDAAVAGPAIDDFESAILTGDGDRNSLRDDAESAQNTVLIVGGLGAAILVTGTVLLVLDLTSGPSDETETTSVGVGPGTVTLITRW